MSAIRPTGERAQLPERCGGFTQQVLSEWAGHDRPRLVHLACIQLRELGWTYRQIGEAFGHSKQWAARHCSRGIDQIGRAFDQPASDGFSNPSDPHA